MGHRLTKSTRPINYKSLFLLLMVYSTKGMTPGLKSMVFTLINRSILDELSEEVTQWDIRCARECLKLGGDVCKYIMIDKTMEKCDFSVEKTTNISTTDVYAVTAWEGVVIRISSPANYESASEDCHRLKGYLASYENLVSAIKYGAQLSCDRCWLISGEVTFSNVETLCELVDSDIRCNLYPDRTAVYDCFYCYINQNILPAKRDYHSACRLLHIRYDDATGYDYDDANNRCQNEFGGHLAFPQEVYNASLNGVQICEIAWFFNSLKGAPYEEDGICWANVPSGYKIHFIKTGSRSAYCSLLNLEPDAYPYPDHNVVHFSTDSTYSDAMNLCSDKGGSLATINQLKKAHEAGFQVLNRAWVTDKRIAFSCYYPSTCSPYGVSNEGKKDGWKIYDAFCFIPR